MGNGPGVVLADYAVARTLVDNSGCVKRGACSKPLLYHEDHEATTHEGKKRISALG